MKYFINRYLPVCMWMIVVFSFSSRTNLPITGGLTEDFLMKKSAHLFEYLILLLLMYRAVGEVSPGRALINSLIFAFTDEIHQLFTPTRSGHLRDVGVDSLGLIAGIFLIIKFQLWKKGLLVPPPKRLKQ